MYVSIRDPRCCQYRLFVSGVVTEWGVDAIAADDDTREVTSVVRDEGEALECTARQCHTLCQGHYEHWETLDGRWLCIDKRTYMTVELRPWRLLDDVERSKQALIQGWLDGRVGKTNWGQSHHHTDTDLLERYNVGYRRGVAQWRRRYPWR